MNDKLNRTATYAYTLVLLLASLALASCTIEIQPLAGPDGARNKTMPPATVGPLANTAWYLTAQGNTQVAIPALAQSPVTLTFGADGQVSGNSGCSAYRGTYTSTENLVTIAALTLTPTTCADQAAATQEAQFLASLQNAATFSLSSERLAIWYGEQRGMLTFTAATAVTPTPAVTAPPVALAEAPVVTATPFPFPTVDAPTPDAQLLPATAVALSPLATPSPGFPDATLPLSPTVSLTTPAESDSFALPAPTPISFAPGITSTEVDGTLVEGATNPYLVQAQQGETMTMTLTSPNNDVQLRISGQDGTVLKRAEEGPSTWTGQLPTAQGYLIEAIAVGPATNYTLQMAHKPLASTNTAERIEWTPGTTMAERSGTLPAGVSNKQYGLGLTTGQSLTIDLTSDSTPLNLTINSPTGNVWTATMNPTANGYAVNYPLTLPETGDYVVTLSKADQTPVANYSVRFTVQ